MQLAMSSGIQEAANWSWLVPKDLGPKALFGRSANPTWAELRASAKHSPGFAGHPEDRNLSSCPTLGGWPRTTRLAFPGAHRQPGQTRLPDNGVETQGRLWAQNTWEKTGLRKQGPERGGGKCSGLPPPPPTPRPFQSHRLNHIVAPKPSLTSKEIFSRCSKRRRAVGPKRYHLPLRPRPR